MKVILVQTERTFEVQDDLGQGYTVTITEDLLNGYLEYDVFDDDGEEVEDDEKIASLIQLIENSNY